ncbi:Metallo-dependent hydrolase [Punctularia strigosozonata HHB-11173 SS5]|uniref:Metallo-dependent hydrolase n=1 Tax=Punctularia strigosozonata (strain HHB-11173) TaxID=741275 RepID=UPI0004416CAE|nr:Metallo-dependent hydrolase [Punctularia strigosozonata HHB-11173 SS5]EIN10803.1 Metallo-dependent hydrolase [Punctularia strigosozonata HHB-11173 SS5]
MPGQILVGTLIDAPTHDALRVRTNHVCVVGPNGRIAVIKPVDPATHDPVQTEEAIRSSVPKEYQELPLYLMGEHEFLCPGMVDCHNHAPQYHQIGTATDYTLFDWLFNVTFPNEAKCQDLVYAKDLYTRLVQRLLRSGTTSAQFFATNHIAPTKLLVEICAAQGLRGFVGLVTADQHSPDYYVQTTEEALRLTEEFITWTHAHEFGREKRGPEDALVHPVITPRFVPTCSLDLLNGLGALMKKYDVRVQSHAAETVDQVLRVKEMHPSIGGGRDVAIFEQVGLLGSRTTLAHCTHMRDYEVRKMAAVGSAVSACPIANMIHSRSVVPVPRYKALGVKLGLGTDIAGGYSASMLGPLRTAIFDDRTDSFVKVEREDKPLDQYTDPDPKTEWPVGHVWAYHLATVGGAEALGISDHSGSLDVGKHFDAILVDNNRPEEKGGQAFEWWPGETPEIRFERWINTGDERNVARVWVAGRLVVGRS